MAVMNNSLCSLLLLVTFFNTVVNSHMIMVKPPSMHWLGNPNTISPPDYDYSSPLLPNGSNFPCKGYLNLFNTSQGASVESWQAGSIQKFVVNGTSPHNGGSCQVSISEDNGATFKALKTFIGGCPVPGKEVSFTVPKEAKSGKVVFAWTWFAHTSAIPEMYMNCAAVTITGTGGTGLSKFPDIFVANVGNGCLTPLGDINIPNPGSNVEIAPNAALVLPQGTACSTSSASAPNSTSSVTTSSTSQTPSTTASPTPTTTSRSLATSTVTPTSAAKPVPIGAARPFILVVLLVAFSLFLT